ncbi:MAG: GNAT family N-acetyltransferase [Flavobacteriaceae bacterium]|nr:MAG: GNAT family N-acetyltransferase [Flavobacteriaceae bacterium]
MEVEHQKENFRFVLDLGEGFEAELNYFLKGQTLIISHTGVPSMFRGNGYAEKLTAFALDFARKNGYKVQPQCSYAVHYFAKNPSEKDLLG